MMKKLFPASLTALALGLGLAIAAPATASAGSVDFRLGLYGNGGGIYIGSGHQRDRKFRHGGICRPGKAIHKAQRRGVRHARIKRVGHRYIVVKGRKRGSRIKMAFYRHSPRCKVAWVDRRERRPRWAY